MQAANHNLTGLKVLVVGLGRSGKAAAELLLGMGASVDLYDAKESEQAASLAESLGVSVSFGERPEQVTGYDLVVMSPGVPVEQAFIREAEADGAEIIGELELAYRYGHGRYVAITGTNGKTTTTTLTGEIFRQAGRKAELAGNIGIAVASQAVQADDDTWLITECSSFQLETIRQFRPEVSALLNITPDHLDRHGTMENYAAAKARIFMNQTEDNYFVYNEDDALTRQEAEKCPAVPVPFSRQKELPFGAFVKDGVITIRDAGGDHAVCAASELLIPGPHNLENALAAAAMAYFAGISTEDIAETFRRFKGVAHRIEDCGTVNGVRYINDSKGTNPDAAVKAVLSFDNIILLAGGYDKGASYEDFIAAFEGRVKALILMGVTAPAIRKCAEAAGFTEIFDVDTMAEAVEKASSIAQEGDTVLLSQACASWGMYPNFEVRGDDFRSQVQKLAGD